jgi:hypothetical protein
LELGQHLVRELDLDDGTDTLGRWMAYHLADLIEKAKGSATAAERARYRKVATDVILKLWSRRDSLPGRAYPLAPFGNILRTLDLLRPEGNPWRFARGKDGERERLARHVFDYSSRLFVALLLIDLPSWVLTRRPSSVAIQALSVREQRVLRAFTKWIKVIRAGTPKRESGTARGNRRGDDTAVDLGAIALDLIKNLSATLGELDVEVRKLTPQALR